MGKMTRLAAVLAVAAFALAACNDDDDGGGGGGNAGGDPQDEIGATFADAFDAAAADDPIDPEPGDAGEDTLTDDPIDF